MDQGIKGIGGDLGIQGFRDLGIEILMDIGITKFLSFGTLGFENLEI